MQAARDRQKSYADLKRKPMEFQVGDKSIEKVGEVAYKLELPEELSRVHNTFHVSNLKKCHADEPLAVPLEMEQSKPNPIQPIVRWNSKRGPEFTWEVKTNSRRNTHTSSQTTPSSSASIREP
ncbi:hypothetical protein Tco_0072737 [Tanacetum coccineum]